MILHISRDNDVELEENNVGWECSLLEACSVRLRTTSNRLSSSDSIPQQWRGTY